jgi:hypothetical protein
MCSGLYLFNFISKDVLGLYFFPLENVFEAGYIIIIF